MSALPPAVRVPWLLTAALVSVVVALVAFMLKRHVGKSPTEAVMGAGVAFAGCLTLCIGVLTAAVIS
ncbi:hypothetical protein ACIQU6_06120 [Streptomyces sp. NPDC090442]|uniref:hypothetical protein n=1 Tax=Streptomyces sp. NPDC090442 TaxID=3365962 RepID=UPI003808BF51